MEFFQANNSAIVAVATLVIAGASLFSAVLTWTLFRENRILRKAGTEPRVAAYFCLDSTKPNVVFLMFANIGSGPARNVQISVDADAKDFNSHNVLFRPWEPRADLTLLPQGERFSTMFGVGPDLLNPEPLKPFKITLSWEDLSNRPVSETYALDITQLAGFIQSSDRPENTAAKALSKIEGHLSSIVHGQARLNVETKTAAQAADEQRAIIKFEERESSQSEGKVR